MSRHYRKKETTNKRFLATTLFLIFTMTVGFIVISCNKKDNGPTDTIVKTEPLQTPTTPVQDTIPVKQPENLSPYTGLAVSKEILSNIPYMIVVENSKEARPQSGISKADIVFETIAEAGIPRLFALFHSESPKEIGPVRSARPYFLVLSKEFGLPFAHCGGSEEALSTIKKEKLMSMNEFAYGKYFWRDKTRKAPHNLYTSAEKMTKLVSDKGYVKTPTFSLKFDKEFLKKSLDAANKVNVKLSAYSSTSYEYKDGLYYKSMDKVKAKDRFDGSDITVSNVVIQITRIQTLDSYGRLKVTQVGEGAGYLISNGKYIKIKWSKKDEPSPTLLTDENGNEIFLSPGKTWWHITDGNVKVDFE